MLQQMFQKTNDLQGSNVFVLVKTGIERHPSSFGRNRYCRNGRDFRPMTRHFQTGRLPSGSPCPSYRWNEKKSRLIQKRQVGPKFFGLFLYAATDAASNAQWPPRFFREPFSPAFDSSIPDPSANATDDWDDRKHETVSESLRPPSVWSKDWWHNRTTGAPSPRAALKPFSAAKQDAPAGQEPAWPSIPLPPSCGRPLSKNGPSRGNNPFCLPLPTRTSRLPASQQRVGDAIPDAFGFHEVS